MFENISHYKIKAGTERNFGLVFAAVFVIISLYPLWFGKNMHLWACIIASSKFSSNQSLNFINYFILHRIC